MATVTSTIKRSWHVLTVLGLLAFPAPALGAADPNDAGDLFGMDIEDLMNIEVVTAKASKYDVQGLGRMFYLDVFWRFK